MTKPGRIIVWLIIATWIAAEAFVTIYYYNSPDDPVFANLAVLVYALVAVGVVCAIDAGARTNRRNRSRY